MPQKFIIKYSKVAYALPPTNYIGDGELALNSADGKLYFNRTTYTAGSNPAEYNSVLNAFVANAATYLLNSLAIGYNSTATDINCLSVGFGNVVSASSSAAIGYNNTISGAYSQAFGLNNKNIGGNSTTLGIGNTVFNSSSSDSIAIGEYVKIGSSTVSISNAMELGYHNSGPNGVRTTAIRLHSDGFVSWTIKSTAPAGANTLSIGTETATQLMPGGLMYYVKTISGNLNLIACYNDNGTLKYKDLGAFTTTVPS